MPILTTVTRPSSPSDLQRRLQLLDVSLDDVSTAITAILGMQLTPESAENAFQVFIKQFKRNNLSYNVYSHLEHGLKT